MSKTARQIVEDAYAALLQRGDLESFLDRFDDNSEMIEGESLPYGGVYRGKDAVGRLIQAMIGEYWDGLAFDIEAIAGDGEYVMAYGRFSATAKRSRRKVSFPLIEVWKIRDGRVLTVCPVYGDIKAAAEALA